MSRCADLENLTVSIESPLLHGLDDYCYHHHRKRSEAVSLAVKIMLSIEKGKDPDFWFQLYPEK
jgi:metal-responsive CopG/Arc/MetJ family transcriptional regulator